MVGRMSVIQFPKQGRSIQSSAMSNPVARELARRLASASRLVAFLVGCLVMQAIGCAGVVLVRGDFAKVMPASPVEGQMTAAECVGHQFGVAINGGCWAMAVNRTDMKQVRGCKESKFIYEDSTTGLCWIPLWRPEGRRPDANGSGHGTSVR